MSLASLIHGSSRPAGRGITIGTPRRYEALASFLFRGRRRAVCRALVATSGAKPGDRVLDVGSGTGYLARVMGAAVGPDGVVEGVDAAPEMVAYASRRPGRAGNCRFQAGTAERLPFPDRHFDVVVSTFVMHHLVEDARLPAVAEMRRVLKPGGRVLVADAPGEHDMGHGIVPLAPLLTGAGFTDVTTGRLHPWTLWASGRSGAHSD
jgi:ubiquinone/menaquinone biosynthesis C-methylase UbiE